MHTLLTWLIWIGAIATVAAWLHERNGGRSNRVLLVNIDSTTLCVGTAALIIWFRL